MAHLIQPHGGKLCNLTAGPERAKELQDLSISFKSIDLSNDQTCMLELLMCGAFSPLTGFMKENDYISVIKNMRLADGTFWPIPVTLDVSEEFARSLKIGERVALRDGEGLLLAVLEVESIWQRDKKKEAAVLSGKNCVVNHETSNLSRQSGNFYLGGTIEGIQMPVHYDYANLRHTPSELRDLFSKMGWRKIVSMQTDKLVHRAETEFAIKTVKHLGANLLLHAAVGRDNAADVAHYTKIRCLQAISGYFPAGMMIFSIAPFSKGSVYPRELLFRSIIAKNYGCSHIIEKDEDMNCEDVIKEHMAELEVELIPYDGMLYVKESSRFMTADEIPPTMTTLDFSDHDFENRLKEGGEIPEWFSYKEVMDELHKIHPPRSKQGFTVFFTGFSGAGKSTVANIVLVKLLEMGTRSVTLLDGDIVRKNLSSELTFSKEHRDINITRIGFVANEITKAGGIAICAPIAPYKKTRDINRKLIESNGGFIEVHVSTSIEICEQRDRKGLYAKARAGIVKGLTGIDDPYEAPVNPEIRLDTADMTPEEAANTVILYLEKEGYIR